MNKKSRFTHLHLHSHYSLLDGAVQIEPLIEKVVKLGMNAVALTDHGSMFGAMEFAIAAQRGGLLPIIGSEVYVASGSHKDRISFKERSARGIGRDYHHLVLIAQNDEGYKNLSRLVSIGYIEGFYYKPRIDKDLLAKYSKGLIGLSACVRGEVNEKILEGRYEEAKAVSLFYNEILDKKFFLEIQDHGTEKEKEIIKGAARLSKETGLKLVATNDVHYLDQLDYKAHDALLAIGAGKLIKDQDRVRYPNDQFYLKSQEEMEECFKDFPEAISNTKLITEMIGFQFETGRHYLPDFPIPEGENLEDYLRSNAEHGLDGLFLEKKRRGLAFDEAKKKLYKKRLDMELSVVNKTGFAGYFLITSDFIKYAKLKDIAVGPGRGSVAGSMLAYLLGITEVDPIEHDLIFERFLNPERISLPDIDIDFCVEGREEVIDYVRRKYGKAEGERSCVANIITFGAMKAKAVIRDVARVMDIAYKDADYLAKLIPNELKMTLDKALATEPKLKEIYDSDLRKRELIDIAKRLEGIARHASTHAAGIVISPRAISDFIPLYKAADSEDLSTQFPMNDVERLGLLKMDFLGLKTLTVIQKSIAFISKRRGVDLDIGRIPLDDPDTYDLLKEGDTLGIFQLESSGMRDLMRRMNPSKFEDLVALVALFRPGPINSGMADQYVKRKNGKEKVTFEFKDLKSLLGETYGVIVYQEQVMKIANILAGFTLGEADLLRKAMGKKKIEIMDELREKFISGAVKRGYNKRQISKLWENIEKFGEYGFNKSHSVCYALIAYRTAYLKKHYMAEYFASLISSEIDKSEKIYSYIKELRSAKIEIFPPDINRSESFFTVSGEGLRFGLSALKGLGESASDAICKERAKLGEFVSVFDFVKRVRSQAINRRVLEALIFSGALDSFGENRHTLYANVDLLLKVSSSHKELDDAQADLFKAEELIDIEPHLEKFEEWSDSEKLSKEKSSLGFYLSMHPLNQYEDKVNHFVNSDIGKILSKETRKGQVCFLAIINSYRILTTKKGDKMARLTVEDMTGSVDLVLFPENYKKYQDLLDMVDPVLIKANLNGDEEQINLIVDEISTVSDLDFSKKEKRDRKRAIFISLDIERHASGIVKEIDKILKSEPGDESVLINMAGRGFQVKFRSISTRVVVSDHLVDRLKTVIGNESVKILTG